MMRQRLAGLALVCGMSAGFAAEDVNPASQVQADFSKRVGEYVKLHKTAHEGLDKLKPTRSAAKIETHERGVAERIRALRRDARQGDVFTPDAAAEFRRLIQVTMQGPEAAHIRASLRRAEPVRLRALAVNGSYPKGVPLQSTPPTLLLNLPKLPTKLQYRVVGRSLVLLDVAANLIVDFIPDAIPARTNAT